MHDKIQRYSLRKLSVGLASVMVGACIFSVNGKTVKADVTSDQTNQVTKVQDQTATTQPQNEKQTSSDQNSVADQSQKNLLDDLGKQKTSTQSGDQAEAQENRLVDQINYKLTNNTSTDHKEDLGQNKVAPDETKSTSATKSDAEKSIVSPSSAQKINNQSNDHAEDNSQPQPQNEPKLDLTKNSKKLAKKVLATNLIETTSSPMTNGGFDEATWGKLDVNNWQGSVQDGIYQLTNYTGDLSHIIVPNEADFEKAGKSTNGLQVGITRDTIWSIFSDQEENLGSIPLQITIAFSKTNNQKVKAIGTNWSGAFSIDINHVDMPIHLGKFDGSNLDVSNVTNMQAMFSRTSISDLTSLKNWDVSNVTSMQGMFGINSISDLTPLKNWNTSRVTDMSYMFASNPDLIDLRPIANWNISGTRLFEGDGKLNLTNINNTPLMQGFLKGPDALADTVFITNNADLVKATINKDISKSTTAKRTITFYLPHATPKTIVQIINYKAIVTVQVTSYGYNSGEIVKTYPVKDSDWQLDTSKQNDDVIIDGVICFKPVRMPHINGYKAHLIKDPVNPTAFLVSFMAVPEQPQNNQSNNDQSSQKEAQDEQNQPEPIQTTPVEDKKTDQIIDHIAYALMHDSSSNADSFEPAQNDSDQLENASDSTQKDDAAKPQKVNAAKHKKHIVKKRVVKRHKKHAKKYHLKRRSRKHTKRAKKRIIKHRKSVSRKFRKHNLKHVKRN